MATRRSPPARLRRGRHGVTLMEVLIALGVMSMGLLGLAALIPVARLQMADALRLDRGAGLGRSAFRDLQVRGLLRPEEWLYSSTMQPVLLPGATGGGLTTPQYGNPGNATVKLGRPPLVPILLDPLMMSLQSTSSNNSASTEALASFPYVLSGTDVNAMEYQHEDWMPRATLRGVFGVPTKIAATQNLSPGMTNPVAERIFRSSDDVIFSIPERKGVRPTAVLSTSGSTAQSLVANQGDYSWAVLAVPNPLEAYGVPVTGTAVAGGDSMQTRQYTAYVMVFYKRDLTQVGDLTASDVKGRLNERAAVVQFLSAGGLQFGSSEATVYISGVDNQLEAEQALALRAGEWLLVTGQQPWAVDPSRNITVAQWYYILSADDQVQPLTGSSVKNGWYRNVRLSGRDWNVRGSKPPPVIENNNPWGFGVILSGLQGVYEKVVLRESDNLWLD